MPIQPEDLDPNGLARRRLLRETYTLSTTNDTYRAAGAIALAVGEITTGWAIAAPSEAVPMLIQHPQSILATSGALSTDANPVSVTLRYTGYDLDGYLRTDDVTLVATSGAGATPTNARVTAIVFALITKVEVLQIVPGSGTPVANWTPLFGHGVGVNAAGVTASSYRTRIAVARKLQVTGQLHGVYINNTFQTIGGASGVTYDPVRSTLTLGSGTAIVAGTANIIYRSDMAGQL